MAIVSLIRCDSYDEEKVYKAVLSALEPLGGIQNFVKPEEKILVKPNFLYPSKAEQCITTHPAVIKAVLRILEEKGYQKILCGDSPGYGNCKAAFEKLNLPMDHFTPMNEEVEKNGLFFVKEALECDAIIGLSKMKTHMLERITGAVKNMYGLICGYKKAKGHVSYPNAGSFAEMLTKIHKETPQRLHIMDAVMAMEGNGPSSGTPTKMNLILASSDPVALDAVFCHLVDLNPVLVPTEVLGMQAGIGNYNDFTLFLDNKEISLKELVKLCGNPDFKVERKKDRLNILTFWSNISSHFSKRPVIEKEKCIKCGLCAKQCPKQALHFEKGKTPSFNYKECIRCYCCQEVCPQHAIKTNK